MPTSIPLSQRLTVASYVMRQKLKGRKRYPLVLMLEVLYRCNLACAGCGKIQYPSHILKRQLSVDDCVHAVEECPTPIVSLPGGEPLLHPEIDKIVEALVKRRKYVVLCTNGILLHAKLHLFRPSKYLCFNVHMDGLEDDHDLSVCREGTYREAVRGIQSALEHGFRVTTNTTLFKAANAERTRRFFDEMMKLGVEGMQLSPGYSYQKAPDQAGFLHQDRAHNLFRKILSRPRTTWRFNQSPLFLEFLAGGRNYDCTPWGNPTYTVFGWQKPCYLLQEGYEKSFEDLLARTRWAEYGHGSGNPKCRDCMVHSGFEASAVHDAFSSLRGLWAMARGMLVGPRVAQPTPEVVEAAAEAVLEEAEPQRGYEGPANAENLRVALDYRGDVTLTLNDGTTADGYVGRLDEDDVHVWKKDLPRPLRIARGRVERIALTGRDTASGQGWQAWIEDYKRRKGSVAQEGVSDA